MVPDDSVMAIGRISVAGGFVEGQAHLILRALDGEPGTNQFQVVIKQIKAALPCVPDMSATDRASILEWCEKGSDGMKRRDRILHSTYALLAIDVDGAEKPELTPIAMHLRTGKRTHLANARLLHREAEGLRDLALRGVRIFGSLSEKRGGSLPWGPPLIPEGTPVPSEMRATDPDRTA